MCYINLPVRYFTLHYIANQRVSSYLLSSFEVVLYTGDDGVFRLHIQILRRPTRSSFGASDRRSSPIRTPTRSSWRSTQPQERPIARPSSTTRRRGIWLWGSASKQKSLLLTEGLPRSGTEQEARFHRNTLSFQFEKLTVKIISKAF